MRTVLVFGSPAFHGDVEAKQELCRSLAAALVSRPGLRLMTGGSLGDTASGGGVDRHAVLGALESLEEGSRQREKVLTVMPRHAGAGFLPAGKVVLDDAPDESTRRAGLVALADAVVTVEGGPGTAEIIQRALELGRPVLPVPGTGGASDAAWETPASARNLRASLGLQDGVGLESWRPGTSAVVGACVALLEECVLRPMAMGVLG
jgi:predicted Rossmann-fold nucleotide-binding protein